MILSSSVINFSVYMLCHVLHFLTCKLQANTIFCFQYMPFVQKKSVINGTHYFDGYAIALLSILSTEFNFRKVTP